ncbi:MAG: transglutaminase domain-containing protein, partial [Minisyncoccia bacterium]
CTNKSNLVIALLRAVKIPAGYGILRIETAKFYGVLMCPFFKKLVSKETKHIYASVFLNGKWQRCDPSLDSEMVEALKNKTPFSEFSGFNITDQELKGIKGILEKKEFSANIDQELSKLPKSLQQKVVLELLNRYLLFLRRKKENLKKFSSSDKIEKEFMKWLKKKAADLFFLFNPIYEKYLIENKKK